MRPRLLSISPWLPEEHAPYAGHVFYHRWLSRLADDMDITVLTVDSEDNRVALKSDRRWDVVLRPAAQPERSGRAGRLFTEVRGLRIDGRGVPMPSLEGVAGWADAPHVVEVQWTATLPLLPGLRRTFPEALIAAVEHDILGDTLRWSKLGDLRLRRRIRDTLAGRTILRQERRLVGACDAIFAFKEHDLELLGAGERGMVLDPWLEDGEGRAPSTGTEDVLFVGAMDRRENEAGILWFLDHVWPDVRRRRPTARLVITGARPGPRVRRSAGQDVVVTGFVPDLAPWYRSAHCVVVPLFSGGGLRFKVPQAMIFGVPLVCTPEAINGLETCPQDSLAGIHDKAAPFAESVVWALENPEQADDRAAEARAWARTRYSFERTMAGVLRRYLHSAASEGSEMSRASRWPE